MSVGKAVERLRLANISEPMLNFMVLKCCLSYQGPVLSVESLSHNNVPYLV